MKRLLILLALFCSWSCFQELSAQREVMYTNYRLNIQEFNPAYAGSRASLAVLSMNRSHFTMVFDRSPITQSLNLHTPSSDNEFVGLGLSIRNERIGPMTNTSIFGDFSYTIRLDPENHLSFGLKAGVGMLDIPLAELEIDDPRDPAFAENYQSYWLPNFGFGIYYRHHDYYVGFSIPKLLEVNYFESYYKGGARTILLERNYFFSAGMVFQVQPGLDIVPTTYIRYQHGEPLEADLTVNFILFEQYSIGAMLRLQDAAGFLVGIDITDQWSVGYSFDWAVLNRVPSFNFGSHELVIRYDLRFFDTHIPRRRNYF